MLPIDESVSKKMFEYLDGSKDFLLETAPDFFREVAAYGVWYNGTVIVLKLIIILLCWKFILKCGDEGKKSIDKDDDAMASFCAVGIIFLGVIGLCVFGDIFSSVKQFTMALFAPKLYIFSQLKG